MYRDDDEVLTLTTEMFYIIFYASVSIKQKDLNENLFFFASKTTPLKNFTQNISNQILLKKINVYSKIQ